VTDGSSSGFWFTTLSGIARAEPAWAEIAHYLDPVRRFLAWRYPRIPEADRDDLAQEVLLAMSERLVAGYDRSSGRFRAYLQGAIRNKVADWMRARGRAAEPLGAGDLELEARAPSADEAAAIDLEALLLRAIRGFHDRHAGGDDDDLALVYCFGDRLLRGLPEADIAAREGVSRDRVKRLLVRARQEIFEDLVADALGRDGRSADCARVADLVREGLRRPRERARLLEREPEQAARDAAAVLLAAVLAARSHFAGLGTEAARELLRGLEEIFGEKT
jgi:RNA polymerase sigma factor (sigma-70 family)